MKINNSSQRRGGYEELEREAKLQIYNVRSELLESKLL